MRFQKITEEINLNPFVSENIHKISENITLLVVLDHSTDINQYSFPLKTIKCYANLHKYNLLIVRDDEYSSCQQKDPMFRRHCISAEVLPTTQWLLFLDADIAIANPSRLIEEYIDENYDLTFYDRFISWEIAMGSYLIRNTPWSRRFLSEFADFESQLPNSFHGTDNGAIHAFLMTKSNVSNEKRQKCLRVWSESVNFYTLFLFELCVRNAMEYNLNEHIRIIPKGRGWVRDIWLTSSKINLERDFMVHGTKTKDRRTYPTSIFDHFRTFFNSQFDWYPFLLNNLNNEGPLQLSLT
ncbi:unnamed protein product [Auanema sp. JU1783]|nr:unnamed protein product [Auanema sp. JU1783]